MQNDVNKKIYTFAIMFTLVAVLFFPVINSQENLTNPLLLENINWWNTTWPYRKLITIDHTKVASDLPDFTVLISISSDTDLATRAQDDGDDITFVLYSDNTTQLNHELELFNGTTGNMVGWVKIPSLSSTIDTKIWLYYGNSICSSQQKVAATWDSHYVIVHHLEEKSGTIYDSTQYNNDGTSYGEMNRSAPGKIDGGYYFDQMNDYIDIANSSSLYHAMENAFTVEAWTKTNNFGTWRSTVTKDTGGTGKTSEFWFGWAASNKLDFKFNAGSDLYGNTSITDTSWHYIVGNFNGVEMRLFLDGTSDNNPVSVPKVTPSNGSVNLGLTKYWGDNYYGGSLDEVRISNIARNNSWLSTSYKNQNNPESFISIGSEELYQYTLTLTNSGTGSGTIQASPGGPYSYGTVVTIWANASVGSTFAGFSGALTGTITPQPLVMNGNKVVNAQFTLQSGFTLTLTISGTGSGTIQASPGGPYSYGTVVTIWANASVGSTFAGFSGAFAGMITPQPLVMNGNKVVNAQFTLGYSLTITIQGSGTVTKNPDQPSYSYGQVVNLTAHPSTGWIFDHWTGNLTGNQNPATLSINGNQNVTASFISENKPPVAVNDSAMVFENSSNNSIDVLTNDYDLNGDNLTILSVTQPLHGISSQIGSYVYYTPLTSYIGSDSFQYNISDGKGGNSSATVVITVKPVNTPPNMPSYPNPDDGENAVSVTIDLGWNGGDPNPDDTVLYDVYFGTSNSPPKVRSNQSALSYDPGILLYNTSFYWKIVAWDNHGASTTGPLWHFTTQQKNEEKIVVNITRPLNHSFYLRNIRLFSLPRNTIVFGSIKITAKVTADAGVDRVEFYIDGKLKKTDTIPPYTYHWITLKLFKHNIMVQAYDNHGNTASDELTVFKL
ncbi:Concanavalin A-like lectin/glucanases superfamily protein [uncultured archaeon]|nr:Concanavalin A-like lectin/glucanases superfamily protein [uncultured archaeon]